MSEKGNAFLNICQLAKHLNVSKSFLYRLQAEEGLPHWKIGRATRYKLSEVIAFLDERRRKGARKA